jgi:hypothetical protein
VDVPQTFEQACAVLNADLESLAWMELAGPENFSTVTLTRAALAALDADSQRLRGHGVDLRDDLSLFDEDDDEPALGVALCGVTVARAVLVDARCWLYEPGIACREGREEIYQRRDLLGRRRWRDAVADATVARAGELALIETRRRLTPLLSA